MAAPSHTLKFIELRNRLYRLYRQCILIESLDTLREAKDTYVSWLLEMRELLEDAGQASRSMSFYIDKVWEHGMSGGMGVEYGDNRSWGLRDALQEETKGKVAVLDALVPVFGVRILEKRDDSTFYYYGVPITIGTDSAHYHLLDILITFADENGFVSDEIIVTNMEQSRAEGLLGKTTDKITKKTIANAITALFGYSHVGNKKFENRTQSGKKLIVRKRGKGLVLNNEIVT